VSYFTDEVLAGAVFGQYATMSTPATPTRAQAEEFANAFAFALLMPEKCVCARVNAGRTLPQLAYEFGVEQSRMKERLLVLGLFDGVAKRYHW
jgi:Zn-dependent peptidase ImmA (M78 family)